MTRVAERTLTGRHVLYALLGFFAVVAVANAAMIWFAVESFPGRSGTDPYREGKAYNRVLAARDAQRSLGWRAAVSLDADGGFLGAEFRDDSGAPVGGLKITGTLRRPATAGFDRTVRLVESAAGVYRARLAPPAAKGSWVLSLEAHGSGTAYATERRLWLK